MSAPARQQIQQTTHATHLYNNKKTRAPYRSIQQNIKDHTKLAHAQSCNNPTHPNHSLPLLHHPKASKNRQKPVQNHPKIVKTCPKPSKNRQSLSKTIQTHPKSSKNARLPIDLLQKLLREVGVGAEGADGELHVLRDSGGRLEAGVEHERTLGGLDGHLRAAARPYIAYARHVNMSVYIWNVRN